MGKTSSSQRCEEEVTNEKPMVPRCKGLVSSSTAPNSHVRAREEVSFEKLVSFLERCDSLQLFFVTFEAPVTSLSPSWLSACRVLPKECRPRGEKFKL